MYQAAVQALLGLRRTGATLSISPCIPTVWPEYSLVWRLGTSRYRFAVTNPDHLSRGVAHATLDGIDVDPNAIPIAADGADHDVQVVIGAPAHGLEGLAAARSADRYKRHAPW
jgi:cyclic beta-1,2-glucan synthetase